MVYLVHSLRVVSPCLLIPHPLLSAWHNWVSRGSPHTRLQRPLIKWYVLTYLHMRFERVLVAQGSGAWPSAGSRGRAPGVGLGEKPPGKFLKNVVHNKETNRKWYKRVKGGASMVASMKFVINTALCNIHYSLIIIQSLLT